MNFDEAKKIFSISTPFTTEELKKKYRILVYKYHPDRVCGDERAMKDVNIAFNVLKTYVVVTKPEVRYKTPSPEKSPLVPKYDKIYDDMRTPYTKHSTFEDIFRLEFGLPPKEKFWNIYENI